MKKINIQIALLDLDVGNIHSLEKSLKYLGYNVNVTDKSKKILSSNVVFLPGDGDFGFLMESIAKKNLKETILETIVKQKYLFGICVGFQALFEKSEEAPEKVGFGVLHGSLTKFSNKKNRVPHIGWEKTLLLKNNPLFENMSKHEYFYYIHSYYHHNKNKYTIGTCKNEIEFTSIIQKDNIFGTQFHPEKSGKSGLQLLQNFMKIVEK